MNIIITPKLHKILLIIGIILTIIALILLFIGACENKKYYNNYVDMPDSIDNINNEIIIEWLADYEKDKAYADMVHKDVMEAEKRVEELYND